MPQCTKCQGTTEYKEGISRKNNKPWKGWKCVSCGNMDFVSDRQPNGPKNTGGAVFESELLGFLERIARAIENLNFGKTVSTEPKTGISQKEVVDDSTPF